MYVILNKNFLGIYIFIITADFCTVLAQDLAGRFLYPTQNSVLFYNNLDVVNASWTTPVAFYDVDRAAPIRGN